MKIWNKGIKKSWIFCTKIFYKSWNKAASLFVSFTATVWTQHAVEGEFFVCQVWMMAVKVNTTLFEFTKLFSSPSCCRKWTWTMAHLSTWVQLVVMTMMCSWTPVLTASWLFKQMTPLQHPAIHDTGEAYSPTFANKLHLKVACCILLTLIFCTL